jgi:hypothetical protein
MWSMRSYRSTHGNRKRQQQKTIKKLSPRSAFMNSPLARWARFRSGGLFFALAKLHFRMALVWSVKSAQERFIAATGSFLIAVFLVSKFAHA